jgi:hypothetical protein
VNQSWTVPMRSCNDISRKPAGTPLGAVGRGLAAGAVGTLAMDLLLYARYRRGGGKQHLFAWEFSSGLSSWDEAPVPGQVGKRLFEGLFQKKLPPQRAELVSNITHGPTGCSTARCTALGCLGGGLEPDLLAGQRVSAGVHAHAVRTTRQSLYVTLSHIGHVRTVAVSTDNGPRPGPRR